MTAINKDVVVALNDAWDRLISIVGIRKSDSLKLGDLVSNATTGPLNLYVSVDGNDANDGTALRPLRTAQEAYNRVPKTISYPVRILLGAGDFAGARIDGFTFAPATSAGAWLEICGSERIVTPTTGAAVGVLTSVSNGSGITSGTVTMTGAGWTVNDFVGKWVNFTAGAGIGTRYIVASNTADTITFTSALGPLATEKPTAGSSFEIVELLTNINDGVYTTSGFQVISTAKYGFDVGCITTNAGATSSFENIVFSKLKMTTTASLGVLVSLSRTAGRAHIQDCWIDIPNSAFGTIGGSTVGQSLSARRVYVTCSTSSTVFRAAAGVFTDIVAVMSGGTLFSWGGVVNGTNLDMTSSGSATVFSILSNASAGFNYARISGAGTTISAASAYGYFQLSNSAVSNATKVVSVSGDNVIKLNTVSGTGNTTVVEATNGANVYVKSDCSITGTTELSVDGTAFTLADMRAATPKYCTNATIAITGTKVWGN